MNHAFKFVVLVFVMLIQFQAFSQEFVATAPAKKRLQVLWRYCIAESISDKDSLTTRAFLKSVIHSADSLGDDRLKAYANYFLTCQRILFSANYEQHFAPGNYQSAIAIVEGAKSWAQSQGLTDIAGSCEHYIGQIYYDANRYGLAFEHLLKADKIFKEIGYEKVPGASVYLYRLGLDYYQFEEYEKSLECLLAATHCPFYTPRFELYTFNAIGLIYAGAKKWDQAVSFYRKTIAKAALYNDTVWVGIGSGNLGNIFLLQGKNDSALFYHQLNYHINTSMAAGEDGAKSALSIATVFIRQGQPDSAAYYMHYGQALAGRYIVDTTESLKYRKRLLAVMVEYYRRQGDYRNALLISDSVTAITDTLRQKLDAKILVRAVGKVEMESHQTQLALLESRKSLNLLRLYFLIALLLLFIIIAGLLFRRYRVRKNRQMQAAEKEKQMLSAEKMRAEVELKNAEGRFTEYLATLKEKTLLIESLDSELQQLKQTTNAADVVTIAANLEKLVSSTILTEENWRQFRALFEQVHPGFLTLLNEKYTDLSPGETRLLILTKLNLSTREMANMLGISMDAVRKARYRLRKKLQLEKDSSFEMAVEMIDNDHTAR